MNISKSMFKNFSRCKNFVSLFDMYMYKNAHHIKTIDDVDVRKLNEDINNIAEGMFSEENEKAMEIFSEMFDDETGEDLTKTSNAQLEAYANAFKEVEILAGEYIKQHFSGNVVFASDTKSQKRFEYNCNNNKYYCYLDIYVEKENGETLIFEVKSTTSNKFYELGKKIIKDDSDAIVYTKKRHKFESIFGINANGFLQLKEETGEELFKEYETKRKKVFDRYDKAGKYIYDIAVQRYFIENALIQNGEIEKANKTKYYLLVLNGDYVFDGKYEDGKPVYDTNLDGEELFSIIDVNTITKEYMPIIDSERKQIEDKINERAISKYVVGKFCERKSSTQCPFYKVCFSKCLVDGSIMEYLDSRFAFNGKGLNGEKLSLFDVINMGYVHLDDIPRDYLSKEKNLIQYDCYHDKKTYINHYKIDLALKNLQYPLYHLDFETFGCPLPRYKGEVPYTQSVFQYSLHIEKSKFDCDKTKDHYEYLAPDHSDNRRALCEKMIKDIDLSKGGTVIVYNQSFEKSRLKELAIVFPDLKKDLVKIRNAVFDLLYVLEGNEKLFKSLLPADMDKKEKEKEAKLFNFYHNDMHGSFSIKKILPLYSNLSYKDLTVHNGVEAVLVYSMLPTFTKEEYEKYYLALEKYCQQDTWAMVEIIWGLYNKKY